MLKLALFKFSEYMRSSLRDRKKLLREEKFKSIESFGRMQFYGPARAVIHEYVAGKLSYSQVEARAGMLRVDARMATGLEGARCIHNAEVLETFLAYQGHRDLALLPTQSFELTRGEVQIVVKPFLRVTEQEQERFLFLLLGEPVVPRAEMVMTARLALAVMRPILPRLPLDAVQILEVRRGIVVQLEDSTESVDDQITEACHEISAMWPTLEPPSDWSGDGTSKKAQLSLPWRS